MFRDITLLLEDKYVFRKLIDLFVHRYFPVAPDTVVAINARGFFFGAPLAYELNTSFIPIRKKVTARGFIYSIAPCVLISKTISGIASSNTF
ncbi:MAG: hypothetical protein CSA26_06660 [Desulfobacterales bacterium]|nr:MAG: hypothetical protein CSA26_06660 [Desulfobacterales bacterium]